MDHQMLCFNCMNTLDRPGQICPHCGYDNTNRSNGPGYLSDCILANQYFLGKTLGHGGFGVTYLGFDLNLKRRVAIKEYYPKELASRDTGHTQMRAYRDCDAEFRRGCDRALDEGRMIATLRNTSNIVQVFNSFPCNGTVYTVMEYIPGQTLSTIVTQNGPMKWNDAYKLMRPILLSLENVHGQNVIHRDISPDNVMLNRETNKPILLDFGAAHLYQGIQGHSYTLRPGYAPPEQYSGLTEQDGRTDEYAACATIYFLLTGKKPMDSTQRAFGDTPMEPPRAFDPSIPAAFENVLLKGMSVRMIDRYKTMADLVDEFDKIVNDPGHSPYLPLIIAGSVLIAAALILTLLGISGKDESEPMPIATTAVPVATTAAPVATTAAPVATTAAPVATTAAPVATTAAPVATTAAPVAATAAPVVTETYRMMRSDVKRDTDGLILSGKMYTVMGRPVRRDEIVSVTFVDTLDGMGENAVDVSAGGDGSVMMWYVPHGKQYDLYFGAEGGVILPEDCGGLFLGYTRVTKIDFSDAVDTSMVTDMSSMFHGCSVLRRLDLSAFDTQNVTAMNSMFLNCLSLSELDLTVFDTRSLQAANQMFCGCGSLKVIYAAADFRLPHNAENVFLNCGTDHINRPPLEADRRLMRSDVVYESEGYFDHDRLQYVMDTELRREQVASVTFTDVPDNTGSNAVNVSAHEDGAVMMWYTQRSDGLYDLYFGTQGKVILPENCAALFYGYTNLTSLNFSDAVDTSGVRLMNYMFGSCHALTELDLSCFDTSNVQNMYQMFSECSSLKELNLSSFDTRNTTYMHAMFYNCASLTTLDLTSFDTGNIKYMEEMFRGCSKLSLITVSSAFSVPRSAYSMFTNCGTEKLTYK